jgi:hypothetical protein
VPQTKSFFSPNVKGIPEELKEHFKKFAGVHKQKRGEE